MSNDLFWEIILLMLIGWGILEALIREWRK